MTASAALPNTTGRTLAVGVLIWIGLALVAGANGVLATMRPPGGPLVILAVVLTSVAVGTFVPAVRRWVDALPYRALVGIHTVRFVGIAFLVLAARGELSPVFAARAGWGDIAAAALAIVLVVLGEPTTRRHRLAVHAWNVFGLADLIVAVGTAAAVALDGATPGMNAILYLPWSFVPTFGVPIFVASHVFLFRRLRAEAVR